ncbi:MAG: GyrI-like domain-containing protein [Candidatus Aminicenantes bacterium]|nr:GyrI-like domain-containing protein [Acidobacteriota bacterium]MCG2811103.1 GyrI-like domain-containing protein [Candidatus Aminicenantes bacterium]
MKGKIDFKKEYKFLFSASAKEAQKVEVPAFKYLMIDGRGDPSTAPEFQEKIQALYGLAYTMKFMLKQDPQAAVDFVVPPLSGLWWAEDIAAFREGRKEEWRWTLLILQPDAITPELLEKAKAKLAAKESAPVFADQVQLNVLQEGLAVQVLHIGPYNAEGPTVARLHDFMKENGYTFNGRHHEIYLSDPRRCQPEKMKTIIRQPVKKI